MRALFLNQFYAPDIAATAQVLAALCQDLAAAGHDITVVCSDARYRTPHQGRQRSVGSGADRLTGFDVQAGVKVHRVPLMRREGALGSPLRRLADRLRAEVEFSVAALRKLQAIIEQQPPEILVAMSSPPTLLGLALLAARQHDIPVVYWVQDVYPEVLAASGLLRRERALDRAMLTGMETMARQLYQRAAAAIVLDAAMGDRLRAAGLATERLHVIEHAADSQAIAAVPATSNRLRALLRLHPQDFVVCYAGNLGRGHDFATLLTALPHLADDPALASVHLLFIGDGEQRERLQSAVPSRLSGRVHFLPPQEASLKNDLLSAGDVALVTLAAEFAGLMTPSKIYPLLAAGRPILYVGPYSGRVAELCAPGAPGGPVGERVRNGDAEGLLAALRRLVGDTSARQAMSAQARHLAETRHDQRLASAAHERLLRRLVSEHGRRRCAPSR